MVGLTYSADSELLGNSFFNNIPNAMFSAKTCRRSPVAEHVQTDVAGDARNPAEGRAGLDRQLLEALVHQKDQRKLLRPATIQERREPLLACGGGGP